MVTTTTLLVTAAALAVVGSGVTAYGMYQQGQASKKMADYNAKIQETNAIASTEQASYEANRIRDRNKRLRGMQVAAAGKSGIDLSGSVEDVMFDSALQGHLDELAAYYKGSVAAGERRSAANLSRASGSAAQQQSYFNAGGTMLGGFGQAAGYTSQIPSLQ